MITTDIRECVIKPSQCATGNLKRLLSFAENVVTTDRVELVSTVAGPGMP